jgi:hypothetical protein
LVDGRGAGGPFGDPAPAGHPGGDGDRDGPHRGARSAFVGAIRQAGIPSVHAQAAITARTQHEALATLHGLLAAHSPSIGAGVGWAEARLDVSRADDVPGTLDGLRGPDVARFPRPGAPRPRGRRSDRPSSRPPATRCEHSSTRADRRLAAPV